jgi:S1-C subfamily serine protease
MKTFLKTIGTAFLAGLAGAAFWTAITNTDSNNPNHGFSDPIQSRFTSENQSYKSEFSPNAPVSFVEASKASTGSVVFIKNFSGTDPSRYSMFDYFFGTGPTQQVSTGSGVIFSSDGYIITNKFLFSTNL